MFKRYGIFTCETDVRRAYPTLFSLTCLPLFEVEREALEYTQKLGIDSFMILPLYVNKKIADKETYKP